MVAADEINMKAKIAASQPDPRQRIIQEVLDNHLSDIDIINAGKEMNPPCLSNKAYKVLLAAWCDEFDVPYNPQSCAVHISRFHYMDNTIDRSNEAIKKDIAKRLKDYYDAKKAAEEAYEALPWHQKVNWVMVFYCFFAIGGLLSLLFGS